MRWVRDVVEQRDYSRRVRKQSDDECGIVQAFLRKELKIELCIVDEGKRDHESL
jgi:hypothetical protein